MKGLNALMHFNAVKLLGVFLWVTTIDLSAQMRDTNFLPEVNITALKIEKSNLGKRTQVFDSSALLLFAHQHLGDLLSNNSSVFIKQYGPGGLNTGSIRGGNAAQTAILWNGINIQNSMLGQTDLSLIPVMLFNETEIEYGGGSSLWGSGSIGGTVHLKNRNLFNKGFRSNLRVQSSDIMNHSVGSSISYSNRKISASLKAFGLNAANHYQFINALTNDLVIQKQASLYQYTFLPELNFLIHPNHSVAVSAWLNKGRRYLPPAYLQQNNTIFQDDEANRFLLEWNFHKRIFQSGFKTAFIHEKLNYNDSLASIKSVANMYTFLTEQENHWQWHPHQNLSSGIHFSSNNASSNNFEGVKNISRLAFFISNTGYYLENKLKIHTNVRWEHTNLKMNPFTYHAGISFMPVKEIELKLNAGKVYRLPTLNDLYWYPGGNKDLKPEQGHTIDGSIDLKKKAGQFHFLISGSVFNRRIQNWILWLPGVNGNPSPMNVQEVWSRGTESSLKITHHGKFFISSISFQSSYILSTIEKNHLENHNTFKKQLIYTPRYAYNSVVSLSYKTISMHLFHNYIGYRFTASDNSAWLNPYQLMSLRIQYAYRLKQTALNTFINVNNLTNETYYILLNRPMPLRYFEIGIQLHYTKPIKTTKTTYI